jgi:hypothetical protein
MIQYSLLGRTAASIRLNTTFRGLAPSPSSGKTDLYSNELTRLCAREDYIEFLFYFAICLCWQGITDILSILGFCFHTLDAVLGLKTSCGIMHYFAT